jgi:dipeptidyl aminopeptidase/acylaminoacyl peptidase
MIRPGIARLLVSPQSRLFRIFIGWAVVGMCCGDALFGEGREFEPERRPVTVRDVISMKRLGLPDNVLSGPVGPIRDLAVSFSPDGKRFVVILKKGNLDQDTNDYSVLLYHTSQALSSPQPEVLFTLSSSSNREAVRNIKWLADSETLAFIGEDLGELPQVYEYSVPKNRLDKVTTHPTAVVAYEISADGKTILFEADPAAQNFGNSGIGNAAAITITTQGIIEILAGDSAGFKPTTTQGEQLFLLRNGQAEIPVPLEDVIYAGLPPLSLSPDGRYALIGGFPRDVPETWSEYKDVTLQKAISSSRRRKGESFRLPRYLLLDTDSGELSPLFDTPVASQRNGVVWEHEGKSVFLSGVHLRLDGVADSAEREARINNTYVVEVWLPGKEIVKVTNQNLRVKAWSWTSGRLFLTRDHWWDTHEQPIVYTKQGLVWKQVPFSADGQESVDPVDVTIEEDANTPPKIYVADRKTRDRTLLLDLNPKFSELNLAMVEIVTWQATDGHQVQGGLFLPPDYKPDVRYPLVIQTHGFLTDKFYMDGPWGSAFAAQPLAGKGFMVLQVGYSTRHDDDQYDNTPLEAPREMAAYEGAIDYLDKRGLIDTSRVGIIGFSRTVYKVAYTLTHSRYRFAAATFADGITAGYFEYLLFPYLSNIPLLNGGLPFGPSLASWLKNSPIFQVEKVDTPLRLEAYGVGSALGFWDWYSALSILRKPVDFIYFPHGTHLLSKPSDRMGSQQGNVEWFCYWLKGEEDEDPAKREQYARWRSLHAMQDRKE